jgi:hypothetical protein
VIEITPVPGVSQGAYGLRIDGIPGARLRPVPPSWEKWTVRRAFGDPGGDPGIREWTARIGLRTGGELVVDRRRRVATYVTPSPLDDAAMPRYLAPLGAVAAVWAGRLALTGGAFLHGDGAWVVLGGAPPDPVVTRDLVVVDRGAVLAGPDAGEGVQAVEPLMGFFLAGPARRELPPAERAAALEGALAITTRAHNAAALLALAELPMTEGPVQGGLGAP